MRRSPSAFRTHRPVSFVIQDDSFLRNVSQEPIAFSDALAKPFWCPHNQVHGKRRPQRQPNSRCLCHLVRARHYHQQIHIAMFVRLPVGEGTEQNNLIRLETFSDLARITAYRRHRNVWQSIALHRNELGWFPRHGSIISWRPPPIAALMVGLGRYFFVSTIRYSPTWTSPRWLPTTLTV